MKKTLILLVWVLLLFTGCNGVLQSSYLKVDDSLKNIQRNSVVQTSDEYQKDVIYFLFVDRFFDGNPQNNVGNNPSQYDSTKTDWKKYWGGDLQGLNSKLSYLKQMGITSVWVTPLVDGIDSLTMAGDAPYHGYWAKNFYNIDEHLGSWADFNALVSNMHGDSFGMKLILDYAPNHSNPNDEAGFGELYKSSYSATGSLLSTWKLTDYLLDSGAWYHRLGGIGDGEWDDPYYCRYKNLFNLSDFNQDNPNTYSYLSDGLELWLSRGVDAVRLDAVKHMNTSFTTQLVSDMRNRLNKDIYFFGEWMDAGAWATGLNSEGQYFANNSGCALLDFGYRSAIENVLKNSSTMRTFAQYLNARETYWANPLKQVVFLDNHDMPRINTVLRSSAGFSEAYAAARTDLGLAITMTVRGVPCIYYGTEHYAANFTANSFGQVGSDPYNREMMPSFATNTNAQNIIRKLSALRQTNTALQCGSYAEKWIDDSILAYERKNGSDVIFVVANIGAAKTISVPNVSFPNGTYQNELGSGTVSVYGGTASVFLAENQVVVISSDNAVSCGNFTIVFKSGSNPENVSFPCDANNWNLSGNVLNTAPNTTSQIFLPSVITSATLNNGNDSARLELKLASNSSWNNQWNFGAWSKTSNIILGDNNRQIAIACSAGNDVTLLIDVPSMSLTASVSAD